MSAEPQFKEINGRNYVCQPLTGTKTLRVATRLTKMLGSTLLVVAARGGLGEVSPRDVFDAVKDALENLDEQELESLVKMLMERVSCAGMGDVFPIFDLHFAGRFGEMMDVVQWVLEVNYKDFFEERLSRTKTQSETAKTMAPAA